MKKTLPKKFYKKMVKPQPEVIVVPVPENRFPKISLAIPEDFSLVIKTVLSSRVFLFNFLCGFLLMAIGLVGFDILENREELGVVAQERQSMALQIEQLKETLTKRKDYRDGLYQLAILEQSLGRHQAAYEHIAAALVLDPDFSEGKKFLEDLVD